jgi:hypothetical protein
VDRLLLDRYGERQRIEDMEPVSIARPQAQRALGWPLRKFRAQLSESIAY